MAEVLAAIGALGVVIGVVDPLVNRIQQFVARCSIFSDNPHDLAKLSDDYAFVGTELRRVRGLLFNTNFAPSADRQLANFEPIVNRIKDNFNHADPRLRELENIFATTSAQPAPSKFNKFMGKSRQFIHAREHLKCIETLSSLVSESKNHLLMLNGFLIFAEKIDTNTAHLQAVTDRVEQAVTDVTSGTTRMGETTAEVRDAATQIHHAAASIGATGHRMEQTNATIVAAAQEMGSKVDNVQQAADKLDSLQLAFSNAAARLAHSSTHLGKQEIFKPQFLVPAMSRDIVLDFTTCDEHGTPVTMEGKLKHSLQSIQISPNHSTPVTAAVGVAGMGGVGKTCAMVGLGWEQDLRNQFTGGVYFISIGKDARLEDVVDHIARAVDACGGARAAKAIREAENLPAAVGKASQWFQGQSALFLCDDILETEENPVGYLADLRQLLTTSHGSRMVISTRSKNIALDSGNVVRFAPRIPEGDESFGILLRYMNVSRVNLAVASKTCRDAFCNVLRKCGGLPLTLAVAGRAIRDITYDCAGNWAEAVEVYSTDLDRKITSVSSEPIGNYPNFDATVQVSLGIVDQWTKRRGLRHNDETPFCCFELFHSLGVFRRQTAVPLFALKKLWRLTDERTLHQVLRKLNDLNLVTWRRGSVDQSCVERIGLHDLILDYCQRQAGNRLVCYHSDLLKEYAQTGETLQTSLITEGIERSFNRYPVGNSLRPWWDVPNDGYIHENLCRHLSLGGNESELVALLCDVRWATFRVTCGGLLGWSTDFELALLSFGTGESANSDDVKWHGAVRGLRLIQSAARDAWTYLRNSPAEVSFQMQSRLCDAPSSFWPVSCFLQSIKKYRKRYIRSVTRCWPTPGGSLCSDMFVKSYSKVRDMDFSKDGRLAVLALGTDVLVLSLETKDIVHRLQGGLGGFVCCVSITFDGKHVASGLDNGLIFLWDTITGKVFGTPWRAHGEEVRLIAIHMVGHRIASFGEDEEGVVWHTRNGIQERKVILVDTMDAELLQFSADGERVFVLFEHGEVHIFNATTGSLEERIDSRNETISPTCHMTSKQGTLVLNGCKNGTIEMFHSVKRTDGTYNTDELVLVGHNDWVTCMDVSEGAGLIVSGSDDHTLRLWDATSGTSVGAPLRGHDDGIAHVAISKDGKRIVSVSRDNNMKMWELEGNAPVEEETTQHDAPIICVAISEDAKYAVSASGDRTLRMWNVVTGEAIGRRVMFLAVKLEVSCGTVRAYGEGGAQCWKMNEDEGLVKHGELVKDSKYYEMENEELQMGESPTNNQLTKWDIRCLHRNVMGMQVGMDKALQLATLPSSVCQGFGIVSWQYAEYESPRVDGDGVEVCGVVVAGLKNGRVLFLELVDPSDD